jgi:hypothetical protein
MSSRGLICVLLALFASPSWAAAPPRKGRPAETLLPSSTQVYVRWDGVQRHREAYRRSAFGQMLHGELGRTLRALRRRVETELKLRAVGDRLLEGAPPDVLSLRNELVSNGLALPDVLAKTGFIFGFEARAMPSSSEVLRGLGRLARGKGAIEDLPLPFVQLTAIFPGAKDHPEVVRFLDGLAPLEKSGEIKRVAVGRRTCRVLKGEPGMLSWAWWMEDKHLVIVGGMGDSTTCVSRVVNAGSGITRRPLYRALQKGQSFEVTTRGFVDGKSINANVRWLKLIDPMSVAAIEDAGLLDIEALRFSEGFEGVESRAVWETDFAPRPRGIGRFLVKKSINLKDLPPLPDDATRWTAGRTNVEALYDLILTVATASKGNAPAPSVLGAAKAFARAKQETRQELEDELGVKFDDLFEQLGDTFLTYTSPSDGLSSLGQVVAVSVKDERKLAAVLDAMLKKLASAASEQLRYRKKPYQGAILREVTAARGGSPVALACTIHKGWLVIALNPQPVQGFVLRAAGKLKSWKPDRRTAEALAKVPADAGLVQVVDPRPSINFLLAAAPLALGVIRNPAARVLLEPGDLPHAGAVTKHLFPNVSWSRFDGKTFRIESRESLWLPLQEIGLEWLPFAAGGIRF